MPNHHLFLKTALLFTAALASLSLHAEIATGNHLPPAPLPDFMTPAQLTKWRAEMTAKAGKQDALNASVVGASSTKYSASSPNSIPFYTGKPYIAETGTYVFKYREYNPEMARWTTVDPKGFPDGANAFSYVNNKSVSFFDDTGLTGKSVLLITVGNLFGNGQNFRGTSGNGSSVNYVDDFVNSYNSTKSSMQQWDSGHTQSQGWFLHDGDIFDKRVASSNNDLLNAASGYDRVFYISHGDVDSLGHYTMMAPDGTFNSTSFFTGLLGGTHVILGTCYNGFSSGSNTSGLNGALTEITWGTALSQSLQKAKDYLWE